MAMCPYCEMDLPNSGEEAKHHPQLKKYMKGIRLAFDQWPETHRSQFADFHDLRKWLQVKAGYGEVTARIPVQGLGEISKFIAVAAMQAAGSYAVPLVRGADLVIVRPYSLKEIGHKSFNELYDKVDREIIAIIGVSIQELHEGARRAA